MADLASVALREAANQRQAPEDVEELLLDGKCSSAKVVGLDKFTNLRSLSLNSIGLSSLEGFPDLPQLEELCMNDNKISGGLQHLKHLVELQSLKLCGNRVKTLDDLKPLADLPKLAILDLEANEVCRSEDFREKVFSILPMLQILDNADKEGNPIDDDGGDGDDEEGSAEGEEADADGDQNEEEPEDLGGAEGAEDEEEEEEEDAGPSGAGVEEEDEEEDGEDEDDDENPGTAFLAAEPKQADEEEEEGDDFEPQEGDENEDEEDLDADDDDEDEEPAAKKRKGAK